MFAFAVIATAFAANANSIKWGASVVSPSSGTTGSTDYMGYLFIASDTSGALSDYITSVSDITTALSKGDTSVLDKAISAANASSVTATGSNAGKMTWLNIAADSKYQANVGSTVGAFLIFVDDEQANYLVAQNNGNDVLSKTVASGEGAYNFAFGSQASNANGWQSIPEPTSGLLLLVGVAGLALRRRRS